MGEVVTTNQIKPPKENIMQTKKQTDYAGIDYGLGKTNLDAQTGIRFGVIPQNALCLDVADCIWSQGKNLSFENYQQEVKDKLRAALSDHFSDRKYDNKPSPLDTAVADCFEVIEQDLSDNYEGDNDTFLYEDDGYKVVTSETDLFIEQSPFYTFAQFCSPCAPGACYLLTPLSKPVESNRAYCLGHDWFENDQAPYPVYSVKTGRQVVAKIAKLVCPNCAGTSRDSLSRLAKVRQCKVEKINVSELNVTGFDADTGTFDCFRCQGSGQVSETVHEEI